MCYQKQYQKQSPALCSKDKMENPERVCVQIHRQRLAADASIEEPRDDQEPDSANTLEGLASKK